MAKEICYNCGQKMPVHPRQTCDDCGGTWSDGIDGCPHCGAGNPFKGIVCLTPYQVEELADGLVALALKHHRAYQEERDGS